MFGAGVGLELQRGGGGGARGPAPATRRARREVPGWPATRENHLEKSSKHLNLG